MFRSIDFYFKADVYKPTLVFPSLNDYFQEHTTNAITLFDIFECQGNVLKYFHMPFAKFRLNVMQVFGMLYYESAILLGLINNTLEKTKWICKSEHYLFRVHGKTKWNFHGFFFHLKMSLKSYYWYHKNCALNEGPD